MEKPTFFARRALLILVLVFFFVPFALRGARMAIQGMKNDVKDWLPKEFAETKDLDDFRKHFLSEQFVLVSWDGCHGDAEDERFRLFVAKLTPETPPSVLKAQAEAAAQAAAEAGQAPTDDESTEAGEAPPTDGEIANPTRYIHHGDGFIGDRLGLYFAGDWYENWGDRGEKWLKGRRLDKPDSNEEAWYFLTPDGDLFRWDGVDAPPAALSRLVYRATVSRRAEGELVHAFGPLDGAWFHSDPRRLRAQLFKTVTTGPDVLASLTRDGGELAGDEEEAFRRLAGSLFGPPDATTGARTTCIMLTLTDAARRNLHLVLGRGMLGKPRGQLYEIASETNIPTDELRMGGPPVDNVAIDEEGSITLVRLIGLSAALGIILSLICFRSITATIMIFFVGGISAIMSLAFVWWSGSSVDAIMMSMPSLVYVLGLSGAAHIMNYYREAVEEHGYKGAPERAVAHGWKPALYCNITTAIGLVTLVSSELVPIRKFGLFSAIGVMATLLILFTYLPSALQIWPQMPRKKTRGAAAQEQSWLAALLDNCWERLAGFIIRHHGLVAISCFVVIGAFSYGLYYMNTSVNLLRMFHADAKIIQDYEWLEQNLGELVPMEIVVRVPKKDQCPSNVELKALREELAAAETTDERKVEIQKILDEAQFQMPFLERMETAARVQQQIEREFGAQGRGVVGKALSAATFVRPLPKPGGSTIARSIRSSTSGRLEAHLQEFLHSDYLRIDAQDQTELWRVSLRVGATKGVDYGEFVADLQQTVEPILLAQQKREHILRQIAKRHAEQEAQPRPLAGSKVLLVGIPAGALAAASSEEDSEEADTAQAAPAARANAASHDPSRDFAPIDQHRIFARALRDLLVNSRLKVSLLPSGETDADLSGYDCVVVMDEPAGRSMSDLKSAAGLVIDARGFAFQPGGAQPTAYEHNRHDVSAVYTGVVPIVYKAQRMLLDSLVESTFWSVITITPLLMWIARSVSAGLVAMLPNVLPVLMVFGGMGWLGIDVDVGSMMTASIALGVAVDDTIHYLNWFREELDRRGDRNEAILAAYKHCATPTLQAATISGLGLSIFAISTFTPTQRFGTLMLVILWLGAVAELIFFPALLAGPLGSVFKPRKKAAQPAQEPAPAGPPQLQVVRHDAAEEDTVDEDAPAAEVGGAPAPHAAKSGIRAVRRDGSHRPRA
jgi:predicted RND superfamily exporter protein